ncbi:hypothetical protein GCM10023318_00680 [Nocardia callitridis]|uniref:SnoaL-like domain-containing protein n=1 Tax=Nocardia callitridis TaxID=648753 RepID=A0ABP9JQY9_9NOCA
MLEVLDGRRPAAQLRAVAAPQVAAAVHTLSTVALPGRALGTASLVAVKVRMADSTTAEIFGRYQRGDRAFAIAACAVYGASRWRLTALRVC